MDALGVFLTVVVAWAWCCPASVARWVNEYRAALRPTASEEGKAG